ncbi:MAG: preprotein translocase subunit SecE [Candidatus Kerfeldbacteria bacterium]|nr:preprotein translocase subunit SecE [Candidatus Kerfeldbacteria bacterium]
MAIRLFGYFRESREELKKVAWPTWLETRNNTLLVVGISLFVALFLGLADVGLAALLNLMTKG